MLQDGSVQLLCLTASSGVPLFSRGATRQLPFSVIGSLNGVHMFGGGQGAVLSSCETERGGRVVWKVFRDSIMLIAVSGEPGGGVSELQLRRLLENTWNCMVLVLGQDELVNARNVERLKRDLRSCYRLIDGFLDRADDGMGDLTHCADCLLAPQPGPLQEALDAFTRAADSEFGCLLVHGKVVVATEKWWRLAPQEVVLLSALVRTFGGSASCDHPVFLPQGSPTVPHRLLRFQLLPGADVCVLCGPSPSLQKAESELVACFWRPLVDALRGCLALAGRCLPASVALPSDVLALLLIRRESARAVSTVRPRDTPSPAPGPTRLRELLRLFYAFAVTRYFGPEEAGPPGEGRGGDSLQEDFALGFTHQPLHCYLVTEECKCYGLQTAQHQLYLLTPVSVPTFALRSVATRTLSALTGSAGL
ncbi:protein fuzzy homolog [Megalops cyprinoides]|uniref:protein fuzzy homolog n=1 Tax=Megalops cyprinoides TaxID=118141 RepID=UPI0018651E7B|nr:protein fuzzy homolog [Megalops cyprinoides]